MPHERIDGRMDARTDRPAGQHYAPDHITLGRA